MHGVARRRRRRRGGAEQHLANLRPSVRAVQRHEHDAKQGFDVRAHLVLERLQPRVHRVHHPFLYLSIGFGRHRGEEFGEHDGVRGGLVGEIQKFGELPEGERGGAANVRRGIAKRAYHQRSHVGRHLGQTLGASLGDDAEARRRRVSSLRVGVRDCGRREG